MLLLDQSGSHRRDRTGKWWRHWCVIMASLSSENDIFIKVEANVMITSLLCQNYFLVNAHRPGRKCEMIMSSSCNQLWRHHYVKTTQDVIFTCEWTSSLRKVSTGKSWHKIGVTSDTLFLDHGNTLQLRHNEHDGVSDHQPHDCLLNRLFRRRSKKTSKPCVTGLCAGNSPMTGGSPHKGPVTREMFPFDYIIMIFCNKLKVSTVRLENTMHSRYLAVPSFHRIRERRPIARPSGRVMALMGCLLWAQSLNKVSSMFLPYHVIFDRDILRVYSTNSVLSVI